MSKEKAKPLTKTQLKQSLALAAGISNQQAALALDALTSLAVDQVRKTGSFTIPGIVKLTKLHKPAQKERKGVNPFTKEEQIFKAKPARNVVKVKPLKSLKDAVA